MANETKLPSEENEAEYRRLALAVYCHLSSVWIVRASISKEHVYDAIVRFYAEEKQ